MLKVEATNTWAKTNVEIIISNIDFSNISTDDYLDSRDMSPFDTDWTKTYDEIEKEKSKLTEKEKLELDKLSEFIRHKAFISASRKLKSLELASYISDDFGLFSDALAMNISNNWLNGLLFRYISGILPSGEITPLDTLPVNI